MTSFNEYLTQGNAWMFVPAAVMLGALHGLEPGHSKTMMAAFIVAIRGTVKQAVLLGLSATLSHTAVIWVLALVGLHYSGDFDPEKTEPYFQTIAGIMVIGMALWMFSRTRQGVEAAGHHHHHDDDHEHHHAPKGRHGGILLATDAPGHLEISVFETNVPPRFRLYFYDSNLQPLPLPADLNVTLETLRPDDGRQLFQFVQRGDFVESTDSIPEPHEFQVTVKISSQGSAAQTCHAHFEEDHHDHHLLDPENKNFADAHEREHAAEIEKRFADRQVTTSQLIMFGLTGGLMPCPAAFAVLLVCLQLKKFTLGFALVIAFSLGLAITLVGVGVLAAVSLRHASKRFSGFGEIARRAPYISSIIMALVGAAIAIQGIRHWPSQ